MLSGHSPSDDKSSELQIEIDRLSEELGVPSMPVGMRTNDGLNIFVDVDGCYHYTFYERGKLGFDDVGGLDDVLYWYCSRIVRSQAAKQVGDRADRFALEHEILSEFSPEWAKIPHDLVAKGFPEQLEHALAPRAISLIDAELGLARGVALAAGNSALGSDVVADGASAPVRQRLHRPDAMLVGAVAVTLLVAAVTVGLAHGVLFGNEPQTPSSVGVAAVRNEAQPSHYVALPPPAAAPRVSAPEPVKAVVAAPAAPQPAAPDEAQLRKMTEPLAESAPGPAAPPVGIAPTASVEEPAPSPLQDAITFVEQTLGIDFDNDGRIGGRAATPAPDQAP